MRAKIPSRLIGLALIIVVALYFMLFYSKALAEDAPNIVFTKVGTNIDQEQIFELFNQSPNSYDLSSASINIYFQGQALPIVVPLFFSQTKIMGFGHFLISSKTSWQVLEKEIQSDAIFEIPGSFLAEDIVAIDLKDTNNLKLLWDEEISTGQLSTLAEDYLFEPSDLGNYYEEEFDISKLNNSQSPVKYPPEPSAPIISFGLQDDAEISDIYNINWHVDNQDFKPYTNELDISEDQQTWQRLYSGNGYSYSLNTFDFKNNTYFLKLSADDNSDPIRTSDKIIPVNIANQVLAPDDIKISEIVSNPKDGEPEWFEIYNNTNSSIRTQILIYDKYNFNKTIPIADKLIIDLNANEYAVIVADTLASRQYYGGFKGKIYFIADGNIGNGLSNTDKEELLKIFDSNQVKLNEVVFGESDKGKVYTDINGIWAWQSTASPGGVNSSDPPASDISDDPPDTVSDPPAKSNYQEIDHLNQLDDLENNADIQVKGTVIALPGEIGSQYFYIEDGLGGIEIYSYDKDFPDLDIGQNIQVRGIFNKSLNRLKIQNSSGIAVLGQDEIEPTEISVSKLEKYYHRLIKISGKIEKKTAHTLTLDNGILVYATSVSKINFSGYSVGMTISAVGIVDKYGEEFRLYLRDKSDLEILLFAEAAATTTSKPKTAVKTEVASSNNSSEIKLAADSSEKLAQYEDSDIKGVVKGLETSKKSSPVGLFLAVTLALLVIIGIYWWRTILIMKKPTNGNSHQ